MKIHNFNEFLNISYIDADIYDENFFNSSKGVEKMDVASMSTAMSQASIGQQVSISVAKMAMDTSKESGDALRQMMESSVNPNLGGNIDLKL